MFGLGSGLFFFSSLLFSSFALWGSVNLWVGYFMMALSVVESAAAGKRALKYWLESCAVLCVTATMHRRQYPCLAWSRLTIVVFVVVIHDS